MGRRSIKRQTQGDRRRLAMSRRGVVSVLSMMFVILFGSLGAAMAIMSRSNITTAATHQHVMRAMGAAETGLAIAHQRLAEASARFVIERGVVDGGFGQRVWTGNFTAADGMVNILPPRTFIGPPTQPRGLAEALWHAHGEDGNIVVDPQTGDISEPVIGDAPVGTDPNEYLLTHWVRTPAVALRVQQRGRPRDVAFQIEYALLASGTAVRVFVTGYDFDYQSRGRAVTRRIVQDFEIVKRVNAAVLSPSKIMIGKNVLVEGDLGAIYTDVDVEYGDPLIMRSDFWGLHPGLDAELSKLFEAIAEYDVDRDNRLRVNHPIEGGGLPDYSNLGYTGASADVTGDGYLDEFDIFVMFFDQDRDGEVVLSEELTRGTPAQGRSPEFTLDDQLAWLIDSSRPDRNGNGIFDFIDNNNNGKFEPDVDELIDVDEVDPAAVPGELQGYIRYSGGRAVLYRDQVLGFRDGVIDRRDQYAKVTGRLVFRVTEGEWIAGQGEDYMTRVRGPIRNEHGLSPVQFGALQQHLPEVTAATFTNSHTALRAAANGSAFEAQVAANLGIPASELPNWNRNNTGSGGTKYWHLAPDDDHDGLPDNWQGAYFERSPFNSPYFSDWYYRPVYENMTFRNVQIPQGTNGLFINCTFIGVTYVRSRIDNSHPNWLLYGRLAMNPQYGRPTHFPRRERYEGESFPTMLASFDRPVYMADPPLDRADIPDEDRPTYVNYYSLPNPPFDPVTGRRVIDTKRYSNNIRFHDCIFVGSIVSDTPQVYTHTRNKLQFTGATRFVQQHPTFPNDPSFNPDPIIMPEIAKSSMMLPHYSVDIGTFNSDRNQDVRLKGLIVAGVLDVRGNASIHGALLLTFRAVRGQPPLRDVEGRPTGNPAMFNASIGYFGPEDGDDESLDPNTLPVHNGERFVGWDLTGDGLADLGPWETPTPEQMAGDPTPARVPFHGYGAISLRFDPDLALPDGLLLPLGIQAMNSTYRETSK
jgi:hypothetical protein